MENKYLVDKDNIRGFMDNFKILMKKRGYDEYDIESYASKFFTNKIIIKYSREEEDIMWDNIYKIAMSQGGIEYLISKMYDMPVFEHRRFRNLRSIYNKKTARFINKPAE